MGNQPTSQSSLKRESIQASRSEKKDFRDFEESTDSEEFEADFEEEDPTSSELNNIIVQPKDLEVISRIGQDKKNIILFFEVEHDNVKSYNFGPGRGKKKKKERKKHEGGAKKKTEKNKQTNKQTISQRLVAEANPGCHKKIQHLGTCSFEPKVGLSYPGYYFQIFWLNNDVVQFG